MHVTGVWTAVGAAITGLILADVLFNWRGSNALLGTGSRATVRESRILAGRN